MRQWAVISNELNFGFFTGSIYGTVLHESFVGPRFHLNWNIVKHSGTYWNVSYRIPRSHCETQMYLKQKCCEHFSNVLNIVTVTQAIAVRPRYCLKLKCWEHFSNVLNIVTVTQAIAVRPTYDSVKWNGTCPNWLIWTAQSKWKTIRPLL